jgi:hypothetical protein
METKNTQAVAGMTDWEFARRFNERYDAYRSVGDWSVGVRAEPIEREGIDPEDGIPIMYTTGVRYVVVANHVHGRVYAAELADSNEAVAVVNELTDAFDADADPRFGFVRTAYGSDDWSAEDEVGLMDDDERAAYGY